MKDLVEALNIFLKYKCDEHSPTHCEHDTLYIAGVTKEEVSHLDATRLEDLGFLWSENEKCWISFRFGSA